MKLANEERMELVQYLCAKTIEGFPHMAPEDQAREWRRVAPLYYPLLSVLPRDYTEEMIEDASIDFAHAASVTLVMIGKSLIGPGVTEEDLIGAISDESLKKMETAHRHLARSMLRPIQDFFALTSSAHLSRSELDEALATLLEEES